MAAALGALIYELTKTGAKKAAKYVARNKPKAGLGLALGLALGIGIWLLLVGV